MLMLPAFTRPPELNRIYCADCIDYMSAIPSGSVDLVVTSPPYNLHNTTGGGLKSKSGGLWTTGGFVDAYDTFDDNMPNDEYVAWQRVCLAQMWRVLSDDGAIFYNHKWRVQDGLFQRLADDVTRGFPVRQIIIWDRSWGVNFNPQYFLPTYEVIYLIAKPQFVLKEGANKVGDVWDITPSQNKAHPNAFPEQLAERCIISTNAQIILDPFSGSGTVAKSARKLGRNFMGCDKSAAYVEMSMVDLAQPYTPNMFEVA